MLPCSLQVLFIWFSQPALCISLHAIKGLIFVMEAGCVLCCEDKFYMKFKGQTSKSHAMHRNSDAGLFPGKYMSICGGQSGGGTGFDHDISVLACHCPYVSAPHLSLSSWCCFQEEDRRRSGNLHITQRSSRSWEHDTELYLQFFKSSLGYWLATSIPDTFHFAGPGIVWLFPYVLYSFSSKYLQWRYRMQKLCFNP